MIRLIGFEIYKVWSKTSYFILIIVLMMANVGLLMYTEKNAQEEYSLIEYGELNKDIYNMNEEQKTAYINELYNTIHGVEIVERVKIYEATNSEINNNIAKSLKEENVDTYNHYYELWIENNYLKYTDNIEKEISLIDDYYNEWKKTSEYKYYLENVQSQAEVLSGISIFQNNEAQNDGFSEKNINKTEKDYLSLTSDNIIFSGSKGITKALTFDMTKYLIAVTIFVIGSILMYEEKEKGLFLITKATIKGKAINICAKLVAMSTSTMIITILFYSVNLIYFKCTTGLGDLSRNIQSIPAYMESVLDINVIEFFILSVLSIGVVFIAAGLIIMLIAIISNYSFYILLSYVMIFAYGVVIYNNIGATSKWNWFKYLNIIGFLNTDKVYGHYLNMNLFGNPVELSDAFLVILAILIIILININILVFCKKKNMVSKGKLLSNVYNNVYEKIHSLQLTDNLKIRKFNKINHIKTKDYIKQKNKLYNKKTRDKISILSFEIYKSLAMYKIWIIILLFGLFSFYKISEIKYYNTPNEICYKNYMNKLQGSLTDDKIEYIEKENIRYHDAFDKIAEIEALVDSKEIDKDRADSLKNNYESITAFYPAFSKVYDNYNYIKEHEDARFVYEKGYYQFFGIGSKKHLILFMQINIILILTLTPIFAMEYKNDMKGLLRTMPEGRDTTRNAKIIYSMIITSITYIIPIVKNMIISINNYGMNQITATMNSIIRNSGIIGNMPIYVALILFVITQLLCAFLMMAVVLAISSKCRNTVYGMLISVCILVIPLIFFIY